MLNRLWNKISHIGVKDEHSPAIRKNIVLTNQYTVVGFAVFFLGGINNFRLGDSTSGWIAEGFGIFSLLGLTFTKLGYFRFTMSYTVFLVSIAAFWLDAYFGKDSGAYLYYFPIILGIAFAFDVRRDRWIILIHFVVLTGFMLFNLFNKHSLFAPPDIPPDQRNQVFAFSLIFSVLSVAFFGYLSIMNHMKLDKFYETRVIEREKSNQIISEALKQREVLFTELHHRVKNNLAVIVGLFNLKINSMKASEAKNILIESRNRILSMALIHNRLYRSTNLDHIDFREFIIELVEEVKNSFPSMSSQVVLVTEIEKADLHINQAIPCGLILNELLSNAYKHAFVDKQSGEIKITFVSKNDHFQLEVSDNGSGFDKQEVYDSVGLSIIEALSDQLDGTYNFTSESGTTFSINFKRIEELTNKFT